MGVVEGMGLLLALDSGPKFSCIAIQVPARDGGYCETLNPELSDCTRDSTLLLFIMHVREYMFGHATARVSVLGVPTHVKIKRCLNEPKAQQPQSAESMKTPYYTIVV